MAGPVLDFWFEFASTYSYPAAMRIGPLARNAGVRCAGVRSCSARSSRPRAGTPRRSTSTRPRAATCGATWSGCAPTSACRSGAPIRFRNRACSPRGSRWSGLGQAWGEDFCLAVFRAEFGEGCRIDDPATIGAILAGLDVDPGPVLEAAQSDDTKAALRRQTDEAERLGVFGAPSFTTTDGELFWGNDRLERALVWAKRGS